MQLECSSIIRLWIWGGKQKLGLEGTVQYLFMLTQNHNKLVNGISYLCTGKPVVFQIKLLSQPAVKSAFWVLLSIQV